jgi:predicted short-subunit dehydrogenase-like oxidoreductase (DUF2520 family)
MLARCMARTISIVGAGRVGKTLGKRLRELGWRIGAVVTRSQSTSRAAVRAIGAGHAYSSSAIRESIYDFRQGTASAVPKSRKRSEVSTPEVAWANRSTASVLASKNIFGADVILISTPDAALAEVVKFLARLGGPALHGRIILHTSGALDRSELAPLARLGASIGSLHPMQTFSGRGVPKLKNVIFAVEGDRRALHIAKQIARALGGIPIAIEGHDKPIYHATAVLVAGSEFALMEASIQMLLRIGFTRRRALQTLLPLTRQMLDNIERLGPRAAWTGPISRGDYAIVAKHAKALRKYPKEFRNAYAALALLSGKVLSKNPNAAMKQLKRALANG